MKYYSSDRIDFDIEDGLEFMIHGDIGISEKLHLIFSAFIARIIDIPAYFISKSINNIIADIKNETFSLKKSFRKFVEKYIKKP